MELNRKSFVLAAASFVAGFLLSLVLRGPSPTPRSTSPTIATGLAMISTQFQPQTFHIVLPPTLSPIPQDIVGDSLREIEIIKQRSLHLLETREQRQIDIKELDQ